MSTSKKALFYRALGAIVVTTGLLVPGTTRAADSDGDGTADESDGVPCDPRAVSVAYTPGQGKFGTLTFEDLWPSKGDIDFNDVTLSYNFIFFNDASGKVAAMQVSLNLLAGGASINNDVKLHLPVPSDGASVIRLNVDQTAPADVTPAANESELVIPLISDHLALLGSSMVNTQANQPSVVGHPLNLYVQFKTPVALDISAAPFDMYIERTGEAGHQIHRPEYPGTDTMNTALFGTADDASTSGRHFVDADGLPFALVIPQPLLWPLETVSIDKAYPDIVAFAASGGTEHQDWYVTNVQSNETWRGGANGTPAPASMLLGPTDPSEDMQCAPWKGTVQFGVAPNTWTYGSATDASGNVLVAGYTYGDANSERAFVTKYSGNGTKVWTQTLPATAFSEAHGVATDAQGNVYVSGYLNGTMGGEPVIGAYDGFVAKLDPAGNRLWVQHVNPSTYAIGFGVAVAADGSVYTAGYDSSSKGFVAKLDGAGNSLWTHMLNVSNGYDPGFGVATDASANVWVSGYGSLYQTEAFVSKFDSSGNPLWTHWSSDSLSWNQGGIATDASGSSYSTGYRQTKYDCHTYSYCSYYYDYYGYYYDYYWYYYGYCYPYTYTTCSYANDAPLTKLDADGNALWTTSVGSPDGAEGLAATVDHAGDALFSGIAYSSVDGQTFAGVKDYFAVKVDPNGNKLWTVEGGTTSYDESRGVCADGTGSVFVAGTTYGDFTGMGNTGTQSFIAKYDANGIKQ